MSKIIVNIAMGIVIISIFISIGFLLAKLDKTEPQPIIDTTQLDSTKVFYSKQLDSINTENKLLQTKIEAKNETIKTLKGLVKENNSYFESITDSVLFEALREIRGNGVK